MTRVIFESPSAEARVGRAARWLRSRREPHVIVMAATADCAFELTRRALASKSEGSEHASFGWQRTTLGTLAASLSRPELVRLGLAPASPLALEAICARVVHEHPDAL